MIVRVAGAAVAAAVAAALPAALAVGLAPPPVFVAPPQAAMTTPAMRPSVAMVRCIRVPPIYLDVDFGDRVRTPADQTVLEPSENDFGGERNDCEYEHRRKDAVRVERRLCCGDDQPDPVDRSEILADDGPDERDL